MIPVSIVGPQFPSQFPKTNKKPTPASEVGFFVVDDTISFGCMGETCGFLCRGWQHIFKAGKIQKKYRNFFKRVKSFGKGFPR